MEQQSNILGGRKEGVEVETGGIPAKERRKKIEGSGNKFLRDSGNKFLRDSGNKFLRDSGNKFLRDSGNKFLRDSAIGNTFPRNAAFVRDAEITELFQFLGRFKNRYSQLKWVHLSGNDAGVWDISVPCPRLVPPGLTAHGMYLEIKTNNSKLSIAQEYFGITMKRAGYVCVVVTSWHEAARAILTYLGDCPAALKCLDQTEQKERITGNE